jgi:TRAP-type mannitol/chloroaromatic compound transport system permease small subunit
MKLFQFIDKLSEWSGKFFGWAVVGLMAIIVYDITLRAFGGSTMWVYETSWMLCGAMVLMGGAYVLSQKAHIRIDLFYNRFSPRNRALFDIIYYLIIFFPLIIIIIIHSIPFVAYSWSNDERSSFTFGIIPVYPIKTIIPVAFTLLGLQGVADFVRTLSSLIKRNTT